MRWTVCVALVMCLVGSVFAADPYETDSITYTGGEYKNETFNYRIMKPAIVEAGKKYPLILFLHGAGERGNDNGKTLKHFCRMMAKANYREQYPCYVLVPQCRTEKKWVNVDWSTPNAFKVPDKPNHQMTVAIAALKKTIKENAVDEGRVYLTGLSMGGYGSWYLGAVHADWFAAVAPICGGGDMRLAKHFVGKPVWAFHGDMDKAVPVQRSREMIEAIKKAGGDPKYTEWAGMGHNVWTRAYSDPKGLMPWMFKQVRQTKTRRKVRNTNEGLLELTGENSPLAQGERIVFLGDSITAAARRSGGFIWTIQHSLDYRQPKKGVTLVNAGISGHKVPDLQKRLDRDVISKKPTVVFIYIGINDVWHSQRGRGTPKDKFESGLHDIIGRIKKASATVVLATPTVIGEKHDGSNKMDGMLEEYAAISRKVAKAENLELCDLRVAFIDYLKAKNEENAAKGILTGDTVHLNGAGNRLVANEAGRSIAAALRNRK